METKTIQEVLSNIQVELKAPKTQDGRFGKSRNVEDIEAALKPLLDKYKCAVILDNDPLFIGERNYIQATATLLYKDKSISTKAQAWEGEISRGLDAPQVTGSASSYARKYALAGLFAIDDTKDPDQHKDAPKAAKTTPPAKPQQDSDPVTLLQKKQIMNMMAGRRISNNVMVTLIETVLGKKTVETFGDFNKVVKSMEEEEQ